MCNGQLFTVIPLIQIKEINNIKLWIHANFKLKTHSHVSCRQMQQNWNKSKCNKTFLFNTVKKHDDHSLHWKYSYDSEYKRKSNGFGTTWQWVNDDRILSFGQTIPLKYA